ncbi:MAG: DUF1800 domain-containing protein [Bacteroidetes bacterium]|nr:MAG: DUF1800 domain-containing protein [Bacteroidota bacterium]
MESHHLQHLFKRAGFGLSPREALQFRGWGRDEVVDWLFEEAGKQAGELVIEERFIRVPGSDYELPLYESERARADKIALLGNVWMDKMLEGSGFLREKMALFWHHHLPVGGQNFTLTKLYLEILRKHALGNFRDLLHEVAKTPAMMRYLDNHHSHKDAPNENFARELMELFTLGVDQYTIRDIQEAARAFTGWRYDHDINVFYLDEAAHDAGEKEFLGKKGNFGGEEIIDLILGKKQCARYLTDCICRFFVNETPDPGTVEELAEHFYSSHYDIAGLMRKIFSSDWFYSEKNQSALVKTPVELVVGFQKNTGAKLVGIKTHGFLLRMMGQRLFAPPNVGGWPAGKGWISTNTILYRTQFPSVVFALANRTVSRRSLAYKVSSRLDHAEFRSLRYFMDAVFDFETLANDLEKLDGSPESFFWGTPGKTGESPEPLTPQSLERILTSPLYQLN